LINGEFSVDISKKVSHNLFILAKSIKVYKDWNVTFSSETNHKLNLVIVGKEFVNFEKLKIPKKSGNGVASILYLNENN
jgi:hypothetical protein